MGWGHGAFAIGKDTVPEKTAAQLPRFDGCLFAYELHGAVHPCLSKCTKDQKQMLAAHHHEGRPLGGNAQLVANKLIGYVKADLDTLKIQLPGSKPRAGWVTPKTVEIVGESQYGPKAGLNASKASSSAAAYAAHQYGGAAVLPDCVTRLIARWCASQSDLVFTDPPAECDGTSAARAASQPPPGHTAVYSYVRSNDSDLVTFPYGATEWTMLLRGSEPDTFRVYDRAHKARTMATLLGYVDGIPGVAEDDHALYTSVEALYLVVLAFSKHDYSWRLLPDGRHSNKTGVGLSKLQALFVEAGDSARNSADPLLAPKDWARITPKAPALHALVANWFWRVMDPAHKGFGSEQRFATPAKVLAVALAFVNHPVAAGAGKTKSMKFWEVIHAGTHQVTVSDTDTRSTTHYAYNGKCAGCSIDHTAATEASFNYSGLCAVFKKISDVEEGGEVGFAPRMTLSWVITHLSKYHGSLEWGDRHHNNDTLNFALPLIDRVKLIKDLRVGTPAPNLLPDSPYSNNPKFRTVVIRGLSPQSFGTMMKVKEAALDKGFYMLHVTVVVEVAAGTVVEVTQTKCFCKSPYKYCRHVVVVLIACSRLEMDHYMTCTSGGSYWKGSARVNASDADVQNRALRISELTPSYTYMSDVKDRHLTSEEVEELLGLGLTVDPNPNPHRHKPACFALCRALI